MEKNRLKYIQILIVISVLATLFHVLILVGVIPFEITWGGRLKTVNEMYVFETLSILINSFFIFVLAQKAEIVRNIFGKKAVTIILWIFFVIFVLNTIGNIFAETTFEKLFTILTLVNALLIWFINKPSK
ncbi:MAG: hypothetical protein RL264_1201 [Bacteroidota bacterium]|jgi:hypothetical protein